MKTEIPRAVHRAYVAAKKARDGAYAPYSKFKVGAALITDRGRLVTGVNVENASYGGTVCAERVAILKGVSEGARGFTDVMVVTNATPPATPCALCLQSMAEFCEPDTRVWIADTREIRALYTFAELLPKPFGPKQLKEGLRRKARAAR